jgi:hypothetical protein
MELQFKDDGTKEIFDVYCPTKELCAGKYELWLVVRGRAGRIILFLKPFFLYYPSCAETFSVFEPVE